MVGLFAFFLVASQNLVIDIFAFPIYVKLIAPYAFAFHEIIEAFADQRNIGEVF